ncbi:DNA-directed RNA polymerase I subunit RPA43 [Aspergillus affinis]|uniref:DNA-directed RNA polymerase I subunit RPA43 n=1 Tax=Aspergillus affinis TaxID=1070780 RepID=UPI0022FE7345|nr:uncharacterized protein KD926_003304 [Aspergillus affinis]KAI9043534.1 hypothetical protein KD926_003304 [Aspergillus affinis]
MAVDEMEIDSNPASQSVQEPEKERKRKHKNKDVSSSSPSKKKRKHDANNLIADETSTREKKSKKSSKKDGSSKSSKKSKPAAASTPDSPYTLTTATLYLPLSPISISPTHALASLMAEHLSPLILTYYAPLKGVVLAYSNATISSTDPAESPRSASDATNPTPLTLAKTAGEYGVLYVYLTATFLVFRPQRGQILEGWVNVQSEGFLGAVALNLFSVGIERKRLPSDWKYIAPGEYEEGQEEAKANGEAAKTQSQNNDNDDNNSSSSEPSTTFDPEKEHFKPVALAADSNPLLDTDATAAEHDESAAAEGYFQSVSGHRVRGTVRFRVVDVDVIPGAERDRGFMSIEGTMLTPEEEAQVVEDERNGVYSFAGTPRRSSSLPIRTEPKTTTAMSGAIPESSLTVAEIEVEGEEAEPEQASPVKKSSSKEKKSKSSKSKKKEKEKK